MAAVKPGDPLWWVGKLEKVISARRKTLQRFDDYYSGKHPLAFATDRFRQAFGALFEDFSDNWCELVVEAPKERLLVQGFRLSTDPDAPSASDDEPEMGDRSAWDIWQRNQLDSDHQVAHTETLVNGFCPVSVWADEDDTNLASIVVEDPQSVAIAYTQGSRRRRAAALKLWRDDWSGQRMATLYLPGGIFKFTGPSMGVDSGLWVPTSALGSSWAPRETPGEPWPLPNPLGVVTMVELRNNPRLRTGGRSELETVIPMQDGVNKLIADLFVASEFASFRQKWATGIEIPKDPETGKPVEAFKAAVDRIWATAKTDAKFGDFSETDLANIVSAVEMLVQHVASQTRTPPHYFYLRGEFPSGESIKSAETGLVAKTRGKMPHLAEGWEEIIRLAGMVESNAALASAVSMETIWGDPESRTEAEHVDAVMKKKTLGVPLQQLWEDLGYSPQQIRRFEQMQTRSSLLGGAGLDLEAMLSDGGTAEDEPAFGQ